ncbi:MAG: leucine-rich repeat domain-containing protein [Clostridia bacterium]|nr:leucine-rich repeat domain-containing protein [Clostridia bacterium]
MKRKLTALIITALICIACLPVISGCKAKTNYTLATDEDGNKYYVLSVSGFTNNIKGEFEIPEFYGEGENRAPVREIAQEGLSGTGITKLIIPKTVTKLGNAAFAYNYNLREVVFKDGCSLTELSRGAFGYCRSIDEITIPDCVKTIGALAFLNCESLSVVTLPESLEILDGGAFQGCNKIENITLPETLKKIGDLAFYDCAALKQITIPDSVADVERTEEGEDGKPVTVTDFGLGYGVFHSCVSLEKAEVGRGITVLRSGVFGYCTSLKEIYLPENLKKIEGAYYINGKLECGHAFHNDEALTDIYFAGSEEEWEAVEKVMTPVKEQGASYDNSALNRAKVHFES